MDFEWDENKNVANIAKHGIDFRDALHVFHDPGVIFRDDDRRDYGERRQLALGQCAPGLLLVVFTERRENVMRIISARRAKQKERQLYAPHGQREVGYGN